MILIIILMPKSTYISTMNNYLPGATCRKHTKLGMRYGFLRILIVGNPERLFSEIFLKHLSSG